MRKLAGVCVSLACAVFLSYYILPLVVNLSLRVFCLKRLKKFVR